MFLLRIAIGSLFAFGLYMILASVFHFPPLKAILQIYKHAGVKVSLKEQIIFPLARKCEKFVHLSPRKKRLLDAQLKDAQLPYTPEFYVASVFINAAIMFVAGLFFLPVFPLAVPIITVFAVILFFQGYGEILKKAEKKRKSVEAEIPRLTSAINQSQNRRQDLYIVLQNYRQIASKPLRKELDKLLSDMRTGNRVLALTKFESRMNSTMVSDLVKGLIGIEMGEDMQAYLISTEMHMNDLEVASLEQEAEKRPGILSAASWLLLLSMIILYVAIFFAPVVQSLRGF